ncbi:MAG: zinc ABC transporter substrate-binding protein, partial [Selenomonadaceae bacterium]|nr:zinc ABC transporter substrate-binding protein [Selenomonadaceae bacterium]
HIWLSLKNAQILCEAITDALSKVEPSQADTLKKNSAAYKEKLAALDKKYRDALTAAQNKTLLFGDRFPFRYLFDDYGLKYFAAFAGCSAETEASFQTIKFLAGKVDELNLPCVMTIEDTNHKIAETIIANTAAKNQKILVLNSMQGKVDGETYLSVMEKNLSVLHEALK